MTNRFEVGFDELSLARTLELSPVGKLENHQYH